MKSLKNKKILVLGSDTPIGFLISQELSNQNPSKLFLHHTFKTPNLPETESVHHVQANVQSDVQIKNLVDSLLKHANDIDVVINANNLYFETDQIFSRKALFKTFQANVFGWIEVCRQVTSQFSKTPTIFVELQSTSKDQFAFNLSQKTSQLFMNYFSTQSKFVSSLVIQYSSSINKKVLVKKIIDSISASRVTSAIVTLNS